MHKLIKCFLVVIFIAAISIGTVCAEDSLPKLVLPERNYNFGSVSQGTLVEHLFEINNLGEAPLRILKLHSDCGCTAISLDTDTIAAGASAKIKASFNTSGFDGPKVKTIRIYTNDPRESSAMLTLEGEVVPEIVLKPDVLDFGSVQAGREYQKSVSVFAEDKLGIKFLDVRSHTQNIEVYSQDYSASGHSGKQITVTLKPGVPEGVFRGRVAIKTSSSKTPVVSLPVLARVEGEIQLEPQSITFGSLSLPFAEAPIKTATLKNSGNELIRIASLESDTPAVSVQYKTLEEGRTYKLSIVLHESTLPIIRARIKIIVEMPNETQKTLLLPVYAVISQQTQ